MISLLESFTDKNSDTIQLARTPSDIDAIIQTGKIAATVAVEGGHILEGKLENLEVLKRKGILYITLTHLHSNNIAESSFIKLWRGNGLTDFGREVIEEMERLGILIDVTHCSERAFWEVLEAVDTPVIYSHGGARRFCNMERNLSDAQIRAVAEKGGVIGIMFSPWYLKNWSLFGGVSLFVRVTEHIAELGGINSVAIGSDFDGWIWTLKGVRDISDTWKVAEGLRETFNEEEVGKILFENIRRVVYRS